MRQNSTNQQLLDLLAHNSANKPQLKNLTNTFCPTVHRCNKCSDISEVTSGNRAEIANLKVCHFSHFQFQVCHQRSLLKCHCTLYIYGPLVKKVIVRFSKDALLHVLNVLSSRVSRSCSFWYMQFPFLIPLLCLFPYQNKMLKVAHFHYLKCTSFFLITFPLE